MNANCFSSVQSSVGLFISEFSVANVPSPYVLRERERTRTKEVGSDRRKKASLAQGLDDAMIKRTGAGESARTCRPRAGCTAGPAANSRDHV